MTYPPPPHPNALFNSTAADVQIASDTEGSSDGPHDVPMHAPANDLECTNHYHSSSSSAAPMHECSIPIPTTPPKISAVAAAKLSTPSSRMIKPPTPRRTRTPAQELSTMGSPSVRELALMYESTPLQNSRESAPPVIPPMPIQSGVAQSSAPRLQSMQSNVLHNELHHNSTTYVLQATDTTAVDVALEASRTIAEKDRCIAAAALQAQSLQRQAQVATQGLERRLQDTQREAAEALHTSQTHAATELAELRATYQMHVHENEIQQKAEIDGLRAALSRHEQSQSTTVGNLRAELERNLQQNSASHALHQQQLQQHQYATGQITAEMAEVQAARHQAEVRERMTSSRLQEAAHESQHLAMQLAEERARRMHHEAAANDLRRRGSAPRHNALPNSGTPENDLSSNGLLGRGPPRPINDLAQNAHNELSGTAPPAKATATAVRDVGGPNLPVGTAVHDATTGCVERMTPRASLRRPEGRPHNQTPSGCNNPGADLTGRLRHTTGHADSA